MLVLRRRIEFASVNNGTQLISMTYDNGMREISRMAGNNILTNRFYDRNDDFVTRIEARFNLTLIKELSFVYGYDKNKNVLQMEKIYEHE